MKSANPYLFIENCRQEMDHYQKILGGEIKNVQFADGIAIFKGHEGKVLHGELHLGDSIIHFSDIFEPVSKGEHVKITLDFDTEEEIRKVYSALLDGGHASPALQSTFWGALHANVTDRNGVGWLLNFQK
ncbi:VOC family protein [Virgibacillus xinjiangensis]|uniref:VOC family protein n=1 Tax=Virgibacillus xinjiangensis TaxID=393090 RepID=A0ABV7CU85_9BACI